MVKSFFGGDIEENKGDGKGNKLLAVGSVLADKAHPNKSLCPSLSLRTRIKGWFILMCVGFCISLISSGLLKSLIKGDMTKFAILYTLGTACSLGSSLFLWGPVAQVKRMFDPTRRIVTCIFLSCIVGVICCIIFYP